LERQRLILVTKFEYVRPHSRSGIVRLADAARIAESLRQESLAVLPTETGYMLAALATSRLAVKRAFEVKGRSAGKVMHIACSTLEMASQAGQLTPRAQRLLGNLTPGPVSVIVPQQPMLPNDLVTLEGTVGLRIPDHPATLQIISEVGLPVTATSLNVSGSAPVRIGGVGIEALNWPDEETVYVVADDDAIVQPASSTLVRVTGPEVEILRPGPVTEAEILRVAGPAA
jgi:L-threonylcarbamoyladenylate synthase